MPAIMADHDIEGQVRALLRLLTSTVHKPNLVPSRPRVTSVGLPYCRKQRSPMPLSYCSPAWRIIVSAQAWASGARGGIHGAV